MQIHRVFIEIWNSKSNSNMYFDFKAKCGALSKIHFGQAIYFFEVLEVKNPMFQMVYKLNLKRRSCVCLKQAGQKRMLSSKFILHFELNPLDFKLDLLIPLMSSKLIWNSPKSRT